MSKNRSGGKPIKIETVRTRAWIAVVIWIVAAAGIITYIQENKQNRNTQTDKTYEVTEGERLQLKDSLRRIITEKFTSGEEKKGESLLWNQTNNEDSYDIRVGSVDYEKGKLIDWGYEQVEWKISLDDWVDFLEGVKPGQKQALVVDFKVTGQIRAIETKSIGGNTVVVYESRMMGSNMDRTYQYYDRVGKRVVYVVVGNRCSDCRQSSGDALFPMEERREKVYREIEKIMSEVMKAKDK